MWGDLCKIAAIFGAKWEIKILATITKWVIPLWGQLVVK